MTEYIIEIPDEYFASYDTKRDMYYPDERDDAMPITPFVRCRDCENASFDEFGGGWCCENCREIKPWNFCCWGDSGDAE